MKTGITKALALIEARKLMQIFGFNGFSFQHIADALGIKKPSLYNHFESKEELGKKLIEDYRHTFKAWSETVAVFEPEAQIGALFENFYKFSSDFKKVCPLSALIADYNSFPNTMKADLLTLYDTQYCWLREIIRQGQNTHAFRNDKSSEELAHLILSIGLGGQFIARVNENPEQIRQLKKIAIDLLIHR